MCFSSAATSVLRMEWKPSLPPQKTAGTQTPRGRNTPMLFLTKAAGGLTEVLRAQLLGHVQPLLDLSAGEGQDVTVGVGGRAVHVPAQGFSSVSLTAQPILRLKHKIVAASGQR